MCALDRRQALVDDLVADLTLVRDTGQFWQGAISRVANFLSSIDVLNVSRIPLSVVGEPIAALVLVHFSLVISTVSGSN